VGGAWAVFVGGKWVAIERWAELSRLFASTAHLLPFGPDPVFGLPVACLPLAYHFPVFVA